MRPDKTLGVLGGMGPAATADFLRVLAEKTPANFDQEHPRMIVYSHTITPDRIRKNKEKLFQKLMDNQVTDDEYMRLSKDLEREEITVEDKIRELKKKQKAVLAKKKEKEINVKIYKEIGEIKKIDRNVVEKLVDKMIVSKEGRVEIQWIFKEIFKTHKDLVLWKKQYFKS